MDRESYWYPRRYTFTERDYPMGRTIAVSDGWTGETAMVEVPTEKPWIYMLCPTIRPNMMLDTLKEWIYKSSGQTRLIAIIDPHTRNISGTSCIAKMLKELNCSKDTDIICFVSDDLYPPQNWDLAMVEETENYCGAVQFNDNIRRGAPIFATGCITYGALKKMNRIMCHPDYYHCWSDNEAFDNLTEMGMLKDVSQTNPATFDHRHFCEGGRPQDENDIYYHSRFEEGKATYERRKKLTVRQRLELDSI